MGAPRPGGFRVALAGCGYWGSKHVRVLNTVDGVEELVLVDSREDRLRSLARSYKVARYYPALGPALEHVEAVVVATPPSTHVPLALAAMRAGKHVLVEKPLAPTSAGARALVTAAAEAGVVLMVGHTFEYNPAVRKLAELVRASELGDLIVAPLIQRMMEISMCECTHACDQVGQRTREGMRQQKYKQAADQHRGQAQSQQHAVQAAEDLCLFIVGAQHGQPHRYRLWR